MFIIRWPLILLIMLLQLIMLGWFLWMAYDIRMYPVKDFGYYIHEFDPWFNYRAAEYLNKHGTDKFFKWYDHKSWYPLGRPVGTTIYPGMQITAVVISEALKRAPAGTYNLIVPPFVKTQFQKLRKAISKRGWIHFPKMPEKITVAPMSINDICVTIPAWFGSIASIFAGLLAYEASRSVFAGVFAVGVMGTIPAALMRSVAGVFDNEAIAVSCIICTFWLWARCVRTPSSWPIAVFAGFSYVYMVAAWGGYIFVINAIGVHALLLVGLGRFNSGVYKAYTIFFVVGTYGAMQIPVVGWTPLRSLEQIGPLGVFFGYQVLAICDYQRRKLNLDVKDFVKYRIQAFGVLVVALVAVAFLLWPMGYFGPLSSRIRALFLTHMKTGNPLVDSVAEHSPANASMYKSHLNLPLDFVIPGSLVLLLKRNNACYMLAVYGYIAWHFSLKMSRLVLICGPITAIMCSVFLGAVADFIVEPFLLLFGKAPPKDADDAVTNGHDKTENEAPSSKNSKGQEKQPAKGKKGKHSSKTSVKVSDETEWALQEWDEEFRFGGMAQIKRKAKTSILNGVPDEFYETFKDARKTWRSGGTGLYCRLALSVFLIFYFSFISPFPKKAANFLNHSDMIARQMSDPTILKSEGRTRDGKVVINDDPLVTYQWLATKTPKDSRVAAWWDYGYQITGIGRRTSLADGNTWNHEQIAMLGRLLSGTQKYSHSVLRHLADYVLIMTGGVNDDLGISTHFARIGNSAFPDHCGDGDPFCQKFTFHGGHDKPSPMMRKSLVYNLYNHETLAGVKANPKLFEEVFNSKRKEVRIFKVLNVSEESKAWVADPANKICDAPGSWYCVGQYPPAIKKFLDTRRSFSQVEDFNKKGEKSAYQKMIEKQQASGKLGEL